MPSSTRTDTKSHSSSKPSIIFIHGFRGNHLGLADIANDFNSDYDVYIPDLPPVGNASLPAYTAENYAKWVKKYITKKGLHRPILIGHSLGSIIVAATAEKYPEYISDRIIFLAPISQKPAPFFSWIAPSVIILPNRTVGWITTKYLFVPKNQQLFHQTLDITHRCAAKFSSRLDVAKAAKFSALHSISDFSFSQKALFIAGETDRLNSQKQTRITAQKYNAQVVFLKSCGHLLNYECPKAVVPHIRAFLQ